MPPRFDVYRAASRQIHTIFADYTALIEPLALDEAYLEVTENQRGLPTASATAKETCARILQDTRLTASAGVSYNKFLAKLASGQRKPAMTALRELRQMNPAPCQVGPSRIEALHRAADRLTLE